LGDQAEENLFRACRRGDKAAYATLAQKHYRRVFALCLGMLANVHDAEDVAQETMLRGFQSIRRLARPERFEPWILRIARNLCIDWLRRQKRAKALTGEPRSSATAETHENHDVERAIRRLPQELRLPLTMYYFEQKDARSIAAKLSISPSLAYERLKAARRQLHELLTEGDSHE
jgi:RNA polymerase sigma-70 factor (ECF subfamily)